MKIPFNIRMWIILAVLGILELVLIVQIYTRL